MKLIRTVKIKLNISVDEVLTTLQKYTSAFNYICKIGFEKKEKNDVVLHHLTYFWVRERFGLPSALAITARERAIETLKSVFLKTKHKKYGSCPKSNLCSIRLNKTSYSLFIDKKEVSILTLSGRKRFPLNISDYHQHYFADWKNASADLCIKNNRVYLHIVFTKDEADIKPTSKLLGIDRGINNIAVTSDNKFYGGGFVKHKITQFQRLRSKLQKKGTKSAKRHLKRIRHQERRFRADINHQISKRIISSLNPGDTIVLEDLTGIRNMRVRKEQRHLLNNWSFFQLEQFLIYKGMPKGIQIKYIDARYTSRRCSSCGFICRGNRKSQSDFHCKSCGFRLNADLNASRNICVKYEESQVLSHRVDVNQPIVSGPSVLDASHQPCAGGN